MIFGDRLFILFAATAIMSADVGARSNDGIEAPLVESHEAARKDQESEAIHTAITPERNDTAYWPYDIDTREGVRLQGIPGAPPVFPRSIRENHSIEKAIDEE